MTIDKKSNLKETYFNIEFNIKEFPLSWQTHDNNNINEKYIPTIYKKKKKKPKAILTIKTKLRTKQP